MDPEQKKQALRKITHGVYVIGVKEGEKVNAFTATWVSQVSFEPPLVMAAIRNDSVSFGMIQRSGVFAINFLGTGQKPLAQHFLKPAHLGGDKLAGVAHRRGLTGAPVLEEAIAYVECRVREVHAVGDHSLVVGEVVEARVQRDDEPMALKETGWHYGG